jgi:hypothetical protein
MDSSCIDSSGHRFHGVESAIPPRLEADSSVLGSNRGAGKTVFQTETANRVRVSTTAHFNDSIVADRISTAANFLGSLGNDFWFAELVA